MSTAIKYKNLPDRTKLFISYIFSDFLFYLYEELKDDKNVLAQDVHL